MDKEKDIWQTVPSSCVSIDSTPVSSIMFLTVFPPLPIIRLIVSGLTCNVPKKKKAYNIPSYNYPKTYVASQR